MERRNTLTAFLKTDELARRPQVVLYRPYYLGRQWIDYQSLNGRVDVKVEAVRTFQQTFDRTVAREKVIQGRSVFEENVGAYGSQEESEVATERVEVFGGCGSEPLKEVTNLQTEGKVGFGAFNGKVDGSFGGDVSFQNVRGIRGEITKRLRSLWQRTCNDIKCKINHNLSR